MPEILLIDIDGTLLDFNKCARLSVIQGFRRHGLAYGEHVFETFVRINDGLWLEIEKGTLTRKRLHEIRWNTIFSELGIDFDGVVFEKTFLEFLFDSHEHVDGADEILKYLSGKYTLCAASNGIHLQQINRLTKAGMIGYFKNLFISEEMGTAKPAKEYFDICFERLGNPDKSKVMIIGDSLTADIAGGKNYGIKTLWYNPDGKTPGGIAPDYTVSALSEIKNIL